MKDRNENRPGYKKTKVGWIPEEWDFVPLSKDINLLSGQHIDAKYCSEEPHGIPYVTGPTCFKYGRVIHNTFTTSPSKMCRENDILVTVKGSGTGSIAKADKSYCISRQIMAVRSHMWSQEFICFRFMFDTKKYKHLSGGLIPGISREDILSHCIPLPPLPEQKKIAEILSTWDKSIEQMRKIIGAKKRRKKALMQQLLTGKKRLPGFVTSKGRKFYLFFDLPEDWECPQIRDFAREYSERNTGGDDWTVLACSKHLGFVESSKYFGKRVFSADTSNYKIIRRGYFGYPSNHIEEGSIGLLLSHNIGIVSPIYTVFYCNESVIPEYLYSVFKTDTYRHIFAISTNASVDRRGSLRWKAFSLIRVPLPSIKEQKAIVEVLNVADNEIALMEKKLKGLEKQKRGLMQKLLTGEVRVKL